MLLEPVCGPAYPLKTSADVVAVLDRVAAAGETDIGLLLDVYHLAVNGAT